VKRIFRLPVLAGGIVMAAVLASLVPTTSSRAYAQATVYYYSYGQSDYGGYGQGYAAPSGANRSMFPSHLAMFGGGAYGYPRYGYVPSSSGYRFDYGTGPDVRVYSGSGYYQPSYGPVYAPFGYRGY
jgi:hypothetical protein